MDRFGTRECKIQNLSQRDSSIGKAWQIDAICQLVANYKRNYYTQACKLSENYLTKMSCKLYENYLTKYRHTIPVLEALAALARLAASFTRERTMLTAVGRSLQLPFMQLPFSFRQDFSNIATSFPSLQVSDRSLLHS